MSRLYVYTLLLVLIAPAYAEPEPRGMLGFKSIWGDIDFDDDDAGLSLGGGLMLGYRQGAFGVEYDYSAATHLDASANPDFNFFSSNNTNSPLVIDDDFDVYSHSLFVSLRAQQIVYIEGKLGYTYLRFKESGGAERVLEEQEHAAAGLGLGLGGEHADVGLHYLLLGKDYRQYALVLRGYF